MTPGAYLEQVLQDVGTLLQLRIFTRKGIMPVAEGVRLLLKLLYSVLFHRPVLPEPFFLNQMLSSDTK